jgi:molecular chaperone GrpE
MSSDPDSFHSVAHPGEQPAIATQLVQRFLQLAGELDALQAQVGRLTAALAHERSQIDVLIGHLGKEVQESDPLQERLVALTEQMSADHEQYTFLSRKLTELATQDQMVRLATVVATQSQVMELGETIQELTRAQQRSNELAEARGQQVVDILTTVQAFLNRRSQFDEKEIVMDAERLEAVRHEARGEFAAQFLPALDGLEAVLDDGRTLLARQRQELADTSQYPGSTLAPNDRATPAGSLVHRLRSRLSGEAEGADVAPGPPVASTPESMATTTALNAWLRALALMRDRFLALMAQEGIQPIPSLKQPFDQRLHVVVQSEQRSDFPPNTIVREVRRGFLQANRVLRYAEVVVARAPSGSSGMSGSGATATTPPPTSFSS